MNEERGKTDAGSAADTPDLTPERLPERRLAELERSSREMMDSTRITPSFDVTASEVFSLVGAARDRDRLAGELATVWAGYEEQARKWKVENERLAARVETQARDWSDDHTHLQELCRKAGIPEEKFTGNPDHFPGIAELADMLVSELAEAKRELIETKRQLEVACSRGGVKLAHRRRGNERLRKISLYLKYLAHLIEEEANGNCGSVASPQAAGRVRKRKEVRDDNRKSRTAGPDT